MSTIWTSVVDLDVLGLGELPLVLVVNFFQFYKKFFFCFVGAIFDLVHNVEAIYMAYGKC